MKNLQILKLAFLSVLTIGAVAGCGGNDDNDNNGSSTTRNNYRIPFTASNDVEYIDAIVPHHMHALEMAERELAAGSSAQVKDLAQQIKDDQTTEIALLANARRELTGQAETPAPPMDAHNDDDLATMLTLNGTEADTFFLTHMIQHHSEGVSIAHRAEENTTRADVKGNTQVVQATQGREIGEMTTLLGR